MRIRLLATTCGTLVLAAVPATAAAPSSARAHAAGLSHRIVPFRSISGFRLDAPGISVYRRLGKPDLGIRHGRKLAEAFYYDQHLVFNFDTDRRGNPIEHVQANGGRFFISKSVKLGSTLKAVRRAYPKLDCDGDVCNIYRGGKPFAPGTYETAFVVRHGRVASIAVERTPPGPSHARAAAATRSIVPYTSIAGVALGASPGAVRARLGRPDSSSGHGGRVSEYDYRRAGLTVAFAPRGQGSVTNDITTDSGAYRAPGGVHVGSAQRDVTRAYPGARCSRFGACTATRGSREMVFQLRRGTVSAIEIDDGAA